DETGALVIRDASAGEERASFTLPLTYVASLDFLPGGQALQIRGSDATGLRVVRWDLAAGRAAPDLFRGPPERVGLAAFSADEKTLATFPAGSGGTPEVKLWEADSGRFLGAMRVPGPVQGLAVATGGRPVTFGHDNVVRLWEDGREVARLDA